MMIPQKNEIIIDKPINNTTPFEKPWDLGTGQGGQELGSLGGHLGRLVLIVGKVPLRLATLFNGRTVNSVLQSRVNSKEKLKLMYRYMSRKEDIECFYHNKI